MRLAFNHSSAQRYLLLLPETVRVVHGHAGAAILLSFFLFRMRYSADAEGWFQVTREAIEAWTGMARDNQESARDRLRKLGLVTEAIRGLPGKLCIKVDIEALYTRMLELENNHTPVGGTKPHNQGSGAKPHNQGSGAKPHNQEGLAKPPNQGCGAKPHNQGSGTKPHNQEGLAKPPNQGCGTKAVKLAGGANLLEADATGTAQTTPSHDASIKVLTTNTISLDTSYPDLKHELTSNSIGKPSKSEVLPDTPEKATNEPEMLLSLVAQSCSSAGKPAVSDGQPKSSRRPADAVRAMCEGLGLTGWRLNFARVAVKDGASRAAWWQLARHHPDLLQASYRLLDKTGERGPVTWAAWLPELVIDVQGHGEGTVLAAMERAIQGGSPRGCWNYFRSLLQPQTGSQSTRAPRSSQDSGAKGSMDLDYLRDEWEQRTQELLTQWGVQ
jgi:hypothetical protein